MIVNDGKNYGPANRIAVEDNLSCVEDDPFDVLATAVIDRACRDYYNVCDLDGDYRKDYMENWFRSGTFELYCDLDPEVIIEGIRYMKQNGKKIRGQGTKKSENL